MGVVESLSAAASPALWCQTFFVGAAATVVLVHVVPPELRDALLEYGARRSGDQGPAAAKRAGKGPESHGAAATRDGGLVASLAAVARQASVPHSWFWHYYLVCVSWTAFWAWQYVRKAPVLQTVARAQVEADARSGSLSVELSRVFIAWSMLAVQGTRRLYESLCVTRPGKSPMLLIHWVLGLLFYTTMNVAVWVHGSGAILDTSKAALPADLLSPRVAWALALFLAASWKQNECHHHLANLKKYTLPSRGMFRYIVCPHYTCECAIYLAVAFLAAPPGGLFNASVLCGLSFVVVNLGATAHGTKAWYAEKFGSDSVARRWKMIPFVF
ncbi:hypothetical protein HIM_06555 [Hirsutella minnesotensis 3608]|uniref:Polyprenal reductase n=1 Tax=Hirsutella minnesotensis 3608 TaxID=1043627 RepID=A0A0F7ZJ12_9HYPO|nr:hypothetical protein HIM_06555 [Hirsutella minnesotensis 3608]